MRLQRFVRLGWLIICTLSLSVSAGDACVVRSVINGVKYI